MEMNITKNEQIVQKHTGNSCVHLEYFLVLSSSCIYISQDLVSGILPSGSDVLSINLLANSIIRTTVYILLCDS
jgi:hypothetical protein